MNNANLIHLLLHIAGDVRPQHRELLNEMSADLPEAEKIELAQDLENDPSGRTYVVPTGKELQARYFGTVKPAPPVKPAQ